MKKFILTLAVVLGIVVATLGMSPSPADAATIPFNQWHTVNIGDCTGQIRITQFGGTGVSQYRTYDPADCAWETGVRVKVVGWDGGYYSPPAGCSYAAVVGGYAPPGCTGQNLGGGAFLVQSAHAGTAFETKLHHCYGLITTYCGDSTWSIF